MDNKNIKILKKVLIYILHKISSFSLKNYKSTNVNNQLCIIIIIILLIITCFHLCTSEMEELIMKCYYNN